jgi:LysR family glycine cleavage system transcriptional activator
MEKLPPLRAIKVFETVGRCGSVTAAADELGVSPGAITQQIHLLEKHLAVRLVQRSGRGIELTSWGTAYYPFAAEAMEQIRKGGRELRRARRSNHLTVNSLPSVASRWLSPLLFDWKRRYSQASIHVEGAEGEPRLEENEADFRISYGNRVRFHRHYQHLFTDYVFPVASPAFLAVHGALSKPRDLLKVPLLWVDWGQDYSEPPTWHEWFADLGLRSDHISCDLTYSLSSAALDATLEGRGAMLAQHSMVTGALGRGMLVQLSDRCLPMAEEYFLAWNARALDKPLGSAFYAWLLNEAKRFEWPGDVAPSKAKGSSRLFSTAKKSL